MPGAAQNFSTPESDYAWLFDCDEERLAAGSGSELIDAYLRVPIEERLFQAGPLDLACRAITVADPILRVDVYARLCALTLARGNHHGERNNRLPINGSSLSGLRLRVSRMIASLPSALVFDLLRHDWGFAAKGYFPLVRARTYDTLAVEARTLMTLAINAGEERLDPQFARLLAATISHFENHFREVENEDLEQTLAFAQLCLKALGCEGEVIAPARVFRAGMEAIDALLARWQAELPPLLWSYIAVQTGFERKEAEGVEALIEKIERRSPRERAEIVEAMWRLPQDMAEQTPGLPWTYGDLLRMKSKDPGCDLERAHSGVFKEIWESVVTEPCEFSPDFALGLVRSLAGYKWPQSIVFARSLAASLPRSEEARKAVEHRFARGVTRQFTEGRRAIEQQRLFMQEALCGKKSKPSLEQRAAIEQEVFEAAYEMARDGAIQNGRTTDESVVRAAITMFASPVTRSDWVLGGDTGRRELLRLAAEAIKAGPVTETLRLRIDEIEEAVETARKRAGLEIGRGSLELPTRAPRLIQDYSGVDHIRALIGLFAPLTPVIREAFLEVEDFAAQTPIAAAPPKKWIEQAQSLALAPEAASVRRLLLTLMSWRYFSDADNNYQYSPHFGHSVTLRRGLVWLCAFWPAEEVVKPLTELALRALDGLVNETIGNACLWSLAQLSGGSGLSPLARIGARARHPKVRQRVNALFEEAARKAGRPRAEIEEEIAPHYGFNEEGVSIVTLPEGAGQAEMSLGARGKAEIIWRDGAGKALKAPSEKMKQAGAAGVKAARDAAREIEADHRVQIKRVEKLYQSNRMLDFARWREFYVEHPFIGPMCRHLIWRAEGPGGAVAGLWRDGKFIDVGGKTRDVSGATIELWHPLDAAEGEIAAWRDRLESLGVDQPFRQAWRETYRVTEAERATGFYSNRFAGHIVRQHQFVALARISDWICRHRVWKDVENDGPSFVTFPEFGVYAEFWTEGAGGQNDPPLAESGVYLYLSTDRVVFHKLNSQAPQNKPAEMRGERLAVEEIPPLAFSEIMRCADLFVSVATIARDPSWLDRGEDAEHPSPWRREANVYWNAAATADLAANGQIRREILARALPALGLGDSMSLDDRHLCVKGARGEYRVHLGSGAAFRADGQHICIVPDGVPKKLALPYEGDDTLALILSKAILLLRDDKITDPVILRQLE
jgi:hypothetical protein